MNLRFRKEFLIIKRSSGNSSQWEAPSDGAWILRLFELDIFFFLEKAKKSLILAWGLMNFWMTKSFSFLCLVGAAILSIFFLSFANFSNSSQDSGLNLKKQKESLQVKWPISCSLKFCQTLLRVAKLKPRSEVSRQKSKFKIFWHEASLRASSFAALSHF